ncbi:MAG: hypothetical protein HYZ93_02780 [Candidatus Omnitrophica bacterium]|nr:hypothetical protein [Candidatus Omnitrophota bacterium]
MKRSRDTARLVAFLVALTLAAPQSAFGLRPTEIQQQKTGLEQLEQSLAVSAPTPATGPAGRPAAGGSAPLTAGLEEAADRTAAAMAVDRIMEGIRVGQVRTVYYVTDQGGRTLSGNDLNEDNVRKAVGVMEREGKVGIRLLRNPDGSESGWIRLIRPTLPRAAGLEERRPVSAPEREKARGVLREFLANRDVADAIRGLSESGVGIDQLKSYFDQLDQRFKEAGYQGKLLTPLLSELPSAAAELATTVYVDESAPRRAEVIQRLLDAKDIVVMPDSRKDDAAIVIGDESVRGTVRQALIQVNDSTVVAVTPALLRYLAQKQLLVPGTVVDLNLLWRRAGDSGEALLIFA